MCVCVKSVLLSFCLFPWKKDPAVYTSTAKWAELYFLNKKFAAVFSLREESLLRDSTA